MIRRQTILGGIFVLAASACGGTDTATTTVAPPPESSTTTATTAAETTAAPPAGESDPAIAVADSEFGEILIDSEGNTLYLFTPDDSGPSVCNGDCAAAWPPLLGPVAAGAGIDAALVGTASRDDGSIQATYNSWPLYYFARDATPGDTNGQGVNDVWYVIAPDGEAIR